MKAMISQPMNGRTDEEIRIERDKIKKHLESQDVEVINTIFDVSGDHKNNPVYYLAKSIEAMADVDMVVFANGWENARGCIIEHRIAVEYGKMIVILPKGGKANEK